MKIEAKAMTVATAAKRIDRTTARVYQLIAAGVLKTEQVVEGRDDVTVESVDAYLRERETGHV